MKSCFHVAVCFSDRNGTYYKDALVTAASVFANASCPVIVHVVHDETLSDTARSAFQRLAEEGEGKRGVLFHKALPVPEDVLQRSRLTGGAWYRFMLPLLTDAESILYLDGDTVCECDVAELSAMDMKNKLFGVVPFGKRKLTELVFVLGLDPARWFNDGVLFMNLKRLREERPAFLEDIYDAFRRCPGKSLDQEAINLYCNRDPEALHFLPDRFNFRVWTDDYAMLHPSEYTGKIVHFAGRKPWQEITMASLVYWKYWERLFPGEKHVAGFIASLPLYEQSCLCNYMLRTRWLRSLTRLCYMMKNEGVMKTLFRRIFQGSLKKPARKELRRPV